MPMNDTMRSMPVTCDRSNRNSLTTVSASSAAPTNHSGRSPRRVAQIVMASAQSVQYTDTDACTSVDSAIAPSSYGTPAQ